MQFAQSIPAGDLGGLDVHQLTPQEAFSALHGVGLPAERDCGEEVVRTLLLSQRVVKAEVRQVRNSNRAIVHSLTFEDGRRLYLGSSPEGAIAYRIAARGDQVEAST
jgi:hypothetical protein